MDDVLTALLEARRAGRDAALLTVVDAWGMTPARPGLHLALVEDGATAGTVGGGALEKAAIARARERLADQSTELVTIALRGDEAVLATGGEPALEGSTAGVRLFIEYAGRGIRVHLFGAGHVGRCVAAALAGQPLFLTLYDERPQPEPVPGADRVIVSDYAGALATHPPRPGGYYVIATPQHEADYLLLRAIMGGALAPAYVGMVGSKGKSRGMIQRLRDELGDAAPWDVLHTPIGLDLGGRTPAEIAISIAAEIQAVRYGRPRPIPSLRMATDGAR